MAKQARARIYNNSTNMWDWTGWFNVSNDATREDFNFGVEFRNKPKLVRVVKVDENDSRSYIDLEQVKEHLDYWVNDEALSFTLMFEMESDA